MLNFDTSFGHNIIPGVTNLTIYTVYTNFGVNAGSSHGVVLEEKIFQDTHIIFTISKLSPLKRVVLLFFKEF